MSRNVLSIGQCSLDHGSISRLLADLGAHAIKVDLHSKTIAAIREHRPHLILINRVNDTDGSSGLDLIRELKSGAESGQIPLMLISNYEDAQVKAIELGAVRGFGKSSLGLPETQLLLKNLLNGTQ